MAEPQLQSAACEVCFLLVAHKLRVKCCNLLFSQLVAMHCTCLCATLAKQFDKTQHSSRVSLVSVRASSAKTWSLSLRAAQHSSFQLGTAQHSGAVSSQVDRVLLPATRGKNIRTFISLTPLAPPRA